MNKEKLYQLVYGSSSDSPEGRPRWVGMAIGFVCGIGLYAVAHGLHMMI
jgi:hypothetical protein